MVFETFSRKRSPESSSSEPRRKSQNRGQRLANESRYYDMASQRTYNDYRWERSSAKTEYERTPPSSKNARMNLFSRSPPRADEEDLEPPGTGSSTLQYTLTSRMSFLTWKDRLYRELEELNCLFTVEPTLKRKANMTLEDELTYRNLAKAVICMRLDDSHLALVDKLNDPLKVMKVLSDFREPELKHLEKRAQQRLDSMVYHATVPVGDFVRSFENLLNEVEKHSGERLADCTKKQHLLSAVVGEFPNIMAGSKTPSNEIRYDDLKKLLIQAVERQAAAKKTEEQRRVANRNGTATERRGAATNAAGQNVRVNEKQSAAKNVETKGQRLAERRNTANEQRTSATNIAVSQGLESRNATAKIEVNDERCTGSNAANNNTSVKEQHPVVEDPRPAVKNTDANQRPASGSNVRGKNADLNQRNLAGATVTNRSPEGNERRPTSFSQVDERPHIVKDAKETEGRPSSKSLVNERPLPVEETKSNKQRSIANSADERPLSTEDAKAIDRHSVSRSDVDERPLPAQDTKVIDRRSVVSFNVDERPRLAKDAKVIDRRSVASSNVSNVAERPLPARDVKTTDRPSVTRFDADERPYSFRDARGNERRQFSTNAASRTEVEDPRPIHERTAGITAALYERRPPGPNASKNELAEQVELDKRIQEQIDTNSRLASSQISCTKCGAFGHLVDDCKRKDNWRKCYNCLRFVGDHVASTCPKLGEYSTVSRFVQPRTNSKFIPESREFKSSLPPSSPSFVLSQFPPQILEDEEEEEEEEEDDLPLVDGLRQVYHIRRRLTTKKLKTGRTARKDLIFTDSDFYMDVEYREMFIEENEEEPGDIILETIKVMSTNQK